MLGSKSYFFFQPVEQLALKRRQVNSLLKIKGYNHQQIAVYIEAYNYFCRYPDNFDGATIVKDLCDIPGLDLDAMLHDFHYKVYNVASDLVLKWRADWLYAKGQERKGKGLYSAYSRFAALTFIGIVFVPYAYLSRGKTQEKHKKLFTNDYELLTKN